MSMWDSDIIFGGKRLDEEVKDGEFFVLDAITIAAEDIDLDGDPNTNNATKTVLTIRRLDENGDLVDGEQLEVGTFASAIADKARKATDSDMPAVIQTFMVESKDKAKNDARVIQFVRPWSEPSASAKSKTRAKARAAAGTDTGEDHPFDA